MTFSKKLIIISSLFISWTSSLIAHEGATHILVFSKTAGFRHTSIESGIQAIEQMAVDNEFEVTASENAEVFNDATLADFNVVVFLSTTGDVLNEDQQQAFERFIQSGGGYVGIHAASDTEYDWPWYGELVGAYFDNHPPGTTQATIEVADHVHPSTADLPTYWSRTDEWYNFRDNPRGDVHVLATLDESTYDGGDMGYDHPIAWCHEYDGGRAWYTGGGHTEASFSEPDFLNHILGGIKYASGESPEDFDAGVDDKYTVTVIEPNPQNPMQLIVLPNFDLLYVERGGKLKLRKESTGIITTAGTLSVFSGLEDGLLGLAIDPDFENNNFLYLIYSPQEENVQRLSRFEFFNDTLSLSSEIEMLEIPTQRSECCHSGGDLEFDGNGNLYITVGDNSNPFQSDGFSPFDEQVGRSAFDAQTTASNSQDLRGKILKIHPEADGTYTIPAGNLFASSDDGKPEIFAMGCRNPFRLAANKTNDEIVWGEVGPDARNDISNRGPRGYDEFNRTSEAGNFGWPYLIADNIPYVDYDFATQVSGDEFDPNNLINDSPNNTGLENLPAGQPAWIHYPYGFFDERPEFGNGNGRTAIAGDYYQFSEEKLETGGFPRYFDNTLFILEWTRNWIKEIRVDEDNNILQINDFLPNLSMNRPIDMHFGPDGAMYVIEWGTGFGGNNADAQIIKIEFKSSSVNTIPVSVASASVTSGSIPLMVDFTGDQSIDRDGDELSFSWDFDGDGNEDSNIANPSHTYSTGGAFIAALTVSDTSGQSSISQVEIVAGNTAPVVNIDFPPNGGFYLDDETVPFIVSATDAEEGSTLSGIDCESIKVEPSIGHDDHSHGAGNFTGCEGEFVALSHGDGPDNVFYVLNAIFNDNGGEANVPLEGRALSVLQPKIKQAEHAQENFDVVAEDASDFLGGGDNIGFVNNGSYLKFSPMNFENIEYVTTRFASLSNFCQLEVHIDSPDGPIVAETRLNPTGGWQTYDYYTTSLQDVGGTHDAYFVFKSSAAGSGLGNFNWFEFHGKGVAKDDSQALKGLRATYFSSPDFTGEVITRKEPMIAWNWEGNSPAEGVPADNFSVRWIGNLEVPTSRNYRFSFEESNGDATIWIGDKVVFSSGSSSGDVELTAGVKYLVRVDYSHTSGDAMAYLRWRLATPENVIHQRHWTISDVVCDSDANVPTQTDVITECDSYTWINGVTYTESNNSASVLVPDVNGCDSLRMNLDLTINTVDVDIVEEGETLMVNEMDATYQWMDCNGNNYAGETSRSIDISEGVSFLVEVTKGGCVETSDCFEIELPVSVDESLLEQVRIFPNPSDGTLNVELGDLKNVSIKVIGLDGRLIYHKDKVSDKVLVLEIKENPGLYLVELATEDKVERLKLVMK